MIKVYEDFNFSRVGQVQSLLEANGIRTFLRNEFGSSVVGELPFVEVIPQLFVLERTDVERAMSLIETEMGGNEPGEDWVCPDCGAAVDGHFSSCWKCAEDPGEKPA